MFLMDLELEKAGEVERTKDHLCQILFQIVSALFEKKLFQVFFIYLHDKLTRFPGGHGF